MHAKSREDGNLILHSKFEDTRKPQDFKGFYCKAWKFLDFFGLTPCADGVILRGANPEHQAIRVSVRQGARALPLVIGVRPIVPQHAGHVKSFFEIFRAVWWVTRPSTPLR
jgi:hypothetical protein